MAVPATGAEMGKILLTNVFFGTKPYKSLNFWSLQQFGLGQSAGSPGRPARLARPAGPAGPAGPARPALPVPGRPGLASNPLQPPPPCPRPPPPSLHPTPPPAHPPYKYIKITKALTISN